MTQDHSVASRFGASPKLARRAGNNTWIVPGDGALCAVQPSLRDGSASVFCNTEEHARAEGLVSWEFYGEGGDGVVSGVLPDGVDAVRVVDDSGAERTVTVNRNAFAAPVDASTAGVTFAGPDGAVHEKPRPGTGVIGAAP